MVRRVLDVLTLDEALRREQCPYCGKKIEDNGIDKHLIRCKRKKVDLESGERLRAEKTRWAVHNECGRVMVLEIRDGLALIENSSRRYVVPASDLTAGGVGVILELVHRTNLSDDQIKELISHLMAMIKNVMIQPAIRTGHRVEFMNQGKLMIGRVKRLHGRNQYIVEANGITINLGRGDIVSIVE